MNSDLIDDDSLSLSRKSLLPGRGFFEPDDLEDEHRADRIAEALSDAEQVLLADPDADGLACAAMLQEVRGPLSLVPTGPHDFAETISIVAEDLHGGIDLFICDLAPNEVAVVDEPLETLAEKAVEVTWFDHHQWPTAVVETVRAHGVDLTIGESEEVCTADVVAERYADRLPEHLIELAAVTRDHDLWIKADSRSDDLADYAHWSDPEEYVETVREHGPDLPQSVHELLAERRAEKQALIRRAIDRAEFVSMGELTIALTYGRCSQNEVADGLREDGADAVAVVKPAGSASLRGSDAFARCDAVARRLGGGGHPQAAGCFPPIYDDMLDFARHWVTEGAIAKQVIRDAFAAEIEDDSN